jgi:hypothetical protein
VALRGTTSVMLVLALVVLLDLGGDMRRLAVWLGGHGHRNGQQRNEQRQQGEELDLQLGGGIAVAVAIEEPEAAGDGADAGAGAGVAPAAAGGAGANGDQPAQLDANNVEHIVRNAVWGDDAPAAVGAPEAGRPDGGRHLNVAEAEQLLDKLNFPDRMVVSRLLFRGFMVGFMEGKWSQDQLRRLDLLWRIVIWPCFKDIVLGGFLLVLGTSLLTSKSTLRALQEYQPLLATVTRNVLMSTEARLGLFTSGLKLGEMVSFYYTCVSGP